MKKKLGTIILGLVISLVAYFLLTSMKASAETRHILQKYAFTAQGTLSNPLSVDFGSGQKNVLVEKKDLSTDKALLLFAFAIDEDEVFALQLFDSCNYSIYKTTMRDKAREEIVILGLGPIVGKKVQLREIFIIGEDDTGVTRAMPVKGFAPMNVLNSPMQLDRQSNIILPTQVGEKTLRIAWNAATNEFNVIEGGTTTSSSQSVAKDESVFDE